MVSGCDVSAERANRCWYTHTHTHNCGTFWLTCQENEVVSEVMKNEETAVRAISMTSVGIKVLPRFVPSSTHKLSLDGNTRLMRRHFQLLFLCNAKSKLVLLSSTPHGNQLERKVN